MGLKTAFYNRINYWKMQVVATAFTKVICSSLYGTKLNN